MATPPERGFFAHASTHAAKAQQEYLFGEATPEQQIRTVRGPRFDWRADAWIVAVLLAIFVGLAALLIAF